MDVVRYRGGLGNQMFQYAFQLSLEKRGRKVMASDGFYRNKQYIHEFCLPFVFPNISLNYIEDEEFKKIDNEWKKIKQDPEKLTEFVNNTSRRFFWVEEESSKYIEDVYKTKACTFIGYWQTEKYFRDIKDEVREKFTFDVQNDNVNDFVKECKGRIGVHVRLGDYCTEQGLYGGICTKDYYVDALKVLKEKTGIDKIVLFSDDIENAYNLFELSGVDVISFPYVKDDGYKDWYDMFLMSKCKHIIIANSSFSWWGAWLNRNINRIVISPKRWLNTEHCPDIVPEGWLRI